MFCEDYIKFENKIKDNIDKMKNKNEINDDDIKENNELIEEFINILQKDKINSNAKQEQIENYFLLKYKNINDK